MGIEMRRVCIGIHVQTEPARLRATLSSIRANTAHDVNILLLPDGPDAATHAALADLKDLPRSESAEPLGAPACFNRLVTSSDADVFVLLESGARVAPLWLEYLLSAFDTDAANALAGPTTNYSWNEQGVYPQAGDTSAAIARTARDAYQRFGAAVRTLEPLYSLADFCYAVRRSVVEAIGAADERYQLGPCWEMDYNIRAARAGFRGVWACAAYVHRPPFTSQRQSEEARLFQTSKRLYQDKFCGARLRGDSTSFRSHCRGDDCSNFAPPDLIQLKQSFPPVNAETPVPAATIEDVDALQSDVTRSAPPTSLTQPAAQLDELNVPLVTCIMPTFNRRSFIPQAVRCFLAQDYPNLELLVLDDGSDPVAECLPVDPRIRYIRLERKLTIGAKRNLACENALGDFIVHWDDDDWYPSWRVSAQMRVLLERRADLCGTSRLFYYEAMSDRAWEYKYNAAGSNWVAGNTLAYAKSFWQHNPFPNIDVGEDSLFVWASVNRTLYDLAEPQLCVASVHESNTSRKETSGVFWHARANTDVHTLLGDDLHLHRALFTSSNWPLVSCIMPTYNRRPFITLAVQSFLAQDYPRKELLIVDDSDDPIADLIRDLPGVRYTHLPARASIGAKRNLACDSAEGEIIAHWDDDDWYAPYRLRYQVRPLLNGAADLTGLINSYVLQLPDGVFWTTQPQLHTQMFVGNVHGGTLVYRRELLAQGLRYPNINLAEDAWLLHDATMRGKRLLRLPNPGVFVYVRHGSNAWREFAPGNFINPSGWQRIASPYTFNAEQFTLYRTAAAALTSGMPSR